MRLTTSQNALHFGIKCSKLRRFLGLRPRPRWGAYDTPPDLLVGRGFLPSAIAASRLRHLQFPKLGRLWYPAPQPRSSGDATASCFASLHRINSLFGLYRSLTTRIQAIKQAVQVNIKDF